MQYAGRYRLFETSGLRTYPLRTRPNKVRLQDLIRPETALVPGEALSDDRAQAIAELADRIIAARRADRAVIVFIGAHPIKNGLGPLLADLIGRGIISLLATNFAGAIHDFELALIGQTSEHVPEALPKGLFGMAYELGYINQAMRLGEQMKLGCGEALGRMICDDEFRQQVLQAVGRDGCSQSFAHPDISVLAAGYRHVVPVTVHATIGTDVSDQHPSFDAAAKGGTSGRDFLIFVQEVTRLAGGVALNIGSAVTGPEVLLKAVSMAANASQPPTGLTTASFDLRPDCPHDMADERAVGYYFRDQKSVTSRIPAAFGGRGYYVQGDHRSTVVALYRAIMDRLS